LANCKKARLKKRTSTETISFSDDIGHVFLKSILFILKYNRKAIDEMHFGFPFWIPETRFMGRK